MIAYNYCEIVLTYLMDSMQWQQLFYDNLTVVQATMLTRFHHAFYYSFQV